MTKKLPFKQGIILETNGKFQKNQMVYIVGEEGQYYFVRSYYATPVEKIFKKYITLI
jgi:hypothetical protein